MAQTKISVSFFLPTTSLSRVSDCFEAVRKVLENEHRARDFFTQIEGPYSDDENEGQNGKGKQGSGLGRGQDRRPADGTGDSDAPANVGADAPKRGRGRPRKSDGGSEAGPGPSEGSGNRDGKGTDRAEGTERNEPQRTREGSGEGSAKGEGRGGSSDRGRDDQRGGGEASRVNPPADDWGNDDDWGSGPDNTGDITAAEAVNLPGDEWPDHLSPQQVDRTDLNTLLGDHYKATGGKDKTATYEIMERVTGERQVNNVKESDYVRLAKALLKDTARYEFGIKKPK